MGGVVKQNYRAGLVSIGVCLRGHLFCTEFVAWNEDSGGQVEKTVKKKSKDENKGEIIGDVTRGKRTVGVGNPALWKCKCAVQCSAVVWTQ
jgi:hypothetical protein